MISLRAIFKPFTSVLFIAAAVTVTTHGAMKAQTVNWVEVESGSPSERCCMGMAYDLATRSTVLFGGVGPTQVNLGDTWVWRGGWHQLSPATSPSTRGYPGLALGLRATWCSSE